MFDAEKCAGAGPNNGTGAAVDGQTLPHHAAAGAGA
jgi:hypothetical protein